jgi:short-subunit dehydrogenase
MKLSGKRVVLTGASGGIGSALCEALIERGASVLAAARHEAPLAALRLSLGNPRLETHSCDITVPEQRAGLAQLAMQRGGAQLLIHAAGTGGFGLFAGGKTDPAVLLEVNALAPIELTRAFLPQLSRSDGAAVVAIGSTFGHLGFPGFADYSASKFALRGWMEAMVREYADQPLRFQWISPRATDTSFNPAAVQALNRQLATPVDPPRAVASQVIRAIERGASRTQVGWPEKLFVRLNGLFPELIDRALRGKLGAVRQADAALAEPQP